MPPTTFNNDVNAQLPMAILPNGAAGGGGGGVTTVG